MEYKQAIRLLHPNTTAEALREIEYYNGFNGAEARIKVVEEACILACEAMEKVMQYADNGDTPEDNRRDKDANN